jgi:hypothetical protein
MILEILVLILLFLIILGPVFLVALLGYDETGILKPLMKGLTASEPLIFIMILAIIVYLVIVFCLIAIIYLLGPKTRD